MSSRFPTFAKSILFASIAFIGISGVLFGQARAPVAYKQAQLGEKLVAGEKVVTQNVGRILRGTIPFDEAAKNYLDSYYTKLALPKMTIKENWGMLPELRAGLLKNLRSIREQRVFQSAVTAIFQGIRVHADPKENFHPAVRYNAILLLGELNAVERGQRRGDGRPAAYADPLPLALDVLLAEYKNPAQIDAVRVAALVGIDRHLKLDLARPAERRIPGAKKQLIFDEMIALLNASPPASRSAEGHAWMQRRAIDILAVLGTVGIKSETNAALQKIVADNDAPMSLRCTASEALARWSPNSRAKIDAKKVSQNLGLIAVKACQDELDRIAALERQEEEMAQLRELIKKPNPFASGQSGAMAGGGGYGMESMYGGAEGSGGSGETIDQEGGMYGSGSDMESMYGSGEGMYGMPGSASAAIPTDPRIVWSQRRLKYQLTCVKRGLEGMATAGQASQQEKDVEQVTKAVEAALAYTDPPEDKPDLEGLAESIQTGLSGLAFLTPEAAAIGVDPASALPTVDLPLGAESAVPGAAPAALPDATALPEADPAALPAAPAVDPAALPVADPALPAPAPDAE